MIKNPVVSVIIPTYNRANLIGKAIKSVLEQTYQDFEIIVVDDGSTDNTVDIIKGFKKKDERFKYIRYKKNRGCSAARNAGIKVARGKYIAFQDSDDEWFQEKLEKQVEVFKNASPEVGVVYAEFWRIKDNRKTNIPPSWIKQKEDNIYKELLKGNFIGTPVVLVRKECFEKVGLFDEHISAFEDWELWIRISKYYHFKFIDKPLAVSYHTSNSVNSNRDNHIRARKLILKKHFQEISKNNKLLSNHYFRIGTSLYSNNDFKIKRDYLVRAIKVYPFNVKLLIALLVLLFSQDIFQKTINFYLKNKR